MAKKGSKKKNKRPEKKLAGLTLLSKAQFPKYLAGGIVKDIILQKGMRKGFYVAQVSVAKEEISAGMAGKVARELKRLTGLAWMQDPDISSKFFCECEIEEDSFNWEAWEALKNGKAEEYNNKQKEKQYEMENMPERTALGKAVIHWLDRKDVLDMARLELGKAREAAVAEFKNAGVSILRIEGRVVSFSHSEQDKLLVKTAPEKV